MIRKAASGCVSLIVLAVFAYLAFFVPLGERTLAEHVSRIAATPEAEELGDDAVRASERIAQEIEEQAEKEARARAEDAAR